MFMEIRVREGGELGVMGALKIKSNRRRFSMKRLPTICLESNTIATKTHTGNLTIIEVSFSIYGTRGRIDR